MVAPADGVGRVLLTGSSAVPRTYARLSTLGHEFQGDQGVRMGLPAPPSMRPSLVWSPPLHPLASTPAWGSGTAGVLVLFGWGDADPSSWPLNQRARWRAQFRNMAVQPSCRMPRSANKSFTTRRSLQRRADEGTTRSMGLHPLGGVVFPSCFPGPILINAGFFVFQKHQSSSGACPSCGSRPVRRRIRTYPGDLLGLSMFLLQWVSFRSMDQITAE